MSNFRVLLFPFAVIYDGVTRIRNWCFDTGVFKSRTFDVPIICVGNLSTGGTGKSPHVKYLADWLSTDYTVAILSRGYGRKTKGYLEVETKGTPKTYGDEPLELKRDLPDILVVVDEDRVHGAETIINDHPTVDLIIMDDGFQHRALTPDLKILLSTAQNAFPFDHVLPMGNLREARKGASRADMIVVTKNDDRPKNSDLEKKIGQYSNADVFFSKMEYGDLIPVFEKGLNKRPLDPSMNCLLITGIADPRILREHLSGRVKILEHIAFPDHHDPSRAELDSARKKFDNFAELEPIIITTKKDAMRLLSSSFRSVIEELPVYYLEMTVRPFEEERFKTSVLEYVRKDQSNSRSST